MPYAIGKIPAADVCHLKLQDIIDAVDLLVPRNPDRLGIGGWSYGGFLTAWTVTHTNRFKAAIAGATMGNLFSMATSTDIAPSFLTRYFGPLASNRSLYDAHSPARFLEDCHTPTLVVDGDARVPVGQGKTLFNGLRFMSRETKMIRYPCEGHFSRKGRTSRTPWNRCSPGMTRALATDAIT